jgi:hypothetical protein
MKTKYKTRSSRTSVEDVESNTEVGELQLLRLAVLSIVMEKTEICTIIFGRLGHLQRNESFGPKAVRASEAGAMRCSPVRHGELSQ